MSLHPNTPPECCPWSLVSGLPCYHGTAVILLNHGAANMHKFVEHANVESILPSWAQSRALT